MAVLTIVCMAGKAGLDAAVAGFNTRTGCPRGGSLGLAAAAAVAVGTGVTCSFIGCCGRATNIPAAFLKGGVQMNQLASQ